MGGNDFFGDAQFFEGFAHHDFGGNFGPRDAGGFGDERDGARGARVDFKDVDLAIFDRELDVHQADDFEFFGHDKGVALDLGDDFWVERKGRERAGGIAGVNAGFFDVLHDAADAVVGAVADAIDVHFGGVAEEGVDEDGVLVGDFDGIVDVVIELLFVGDDFHAAAAEDEGGADEDGVTNFFGDDAGFGGGACGAAVGLFEVEFFDHLVEEFAVFGGFDGFDSGADDGDAGVFQSAGEVEGGLAAELDDNAVDEAGGRGLRVED